jgi:hypothetical protein
VRPILSITVGGGDLGFLPAVVAACSRTAVCKLHASRDLIIAELVVSNLADHQGMIA